MGLLNWLFGNKTETVNTPTTLNTVKTPAPAKAPAPVCNLNTSNPHDISYALACMVGYSALRDPDEQESALLVRIDHEKMTTSIYAHGPNWITNHKSVGEYTRIGVPTHIADYLSRVDFDINPDNKALKIEFKGAADTNHIMQKIQEGLNLLPYRVRTCQLKSYPLSGELSTVCIDLFVCDD